MRCAASDLEIHQMCEKCAALGVATEVHHPLPPKSDGMDQRDIEDSMWCTFHKWLIPIFVSREYMHMAFEDFCARKAQ